MVSRVDVIKLDSLNILLVDDDPFALELQAHVTNQAIPGCCVTSINEPTAVIDVCLAGSFDCVLLDYDMPILNGLTLAKQLRENHPYLPVILCTGAGDELLAAQALHGGVADYIPKSAIRPAALRRTILQAISTSNNLKTINEQQSELEGFAFALAHDFKQPLRQISTFAKLACHEIDGGSIEEARQHLDYLGGAARRLSALVDVMSQYTLLSKPIEPEAVHLGSVINDVIESLSIYVEERSGSVNISGDSVIFGNRVFLHQIMHNLVLNGLKYNESATPEINISVSSIDDRCHIRVTDNGIGIGRAYLEKIFQPLARLHTNSEYSGSGLGLTMARKAAAAQGGAISCRSDLGVGSEFLVSLPLAPES